MTGWMGAKEEGDFRDCHEGRKWMEGQRTYERNKGKRGRRSRDVTIGRVTGKGDGWNKWL